MQGAGEHRKLALWQQCKFATLLLYAVGFACRHLWCLTACQLKVPCAPSSKFHVVHRACSNVHMSLFLFNLSAVIAFTHTLLCVMFSIA